MPFSSFESFHCCCFFITMQVKRTRVTRSSSLGEISLFSQVKRTRVTRSSSLGEISLFSQVRPIDAPTAMWEKNAAPAAAIKRPIQCNSKVSDQGVCLYPEGNQVRAVRSLRMRCLVPSFSRSHQAVSTTRGEMWVE
ncbi:uncharacterized protein LOC122089930 [Macadamia integrifolia]|uniref:uncharacterized protein LOC122089930 n=1 Tax=Macadamia integrifolia TaxID=60698 RepID=UPI001C4EAB6E|nr:uncharacterized protein LOC122089930 [Macadamia integrifolia]